MHHEGWVPYGQPNGSHKVSLLRFKLLKRSWRRGPGSNRRIKVLQTYRGQLRGFADSCK